MLRLYNTLTKQIEDFVPMMPGEVKLYCCGPTVYDYAHIGNFRTYTMTDFLVRTLKYLGFSVRYVMNVTDVGHLVSDADSGEDKLEKGSRREGKNAWDIAKFYTDAFLGDSKRLNLLNPDARPKPTEHISEQISMVQVLIDKGFAYTIDDGIYFDTSKFASYGALTGQNLDELKAGARVEINEQKRNPSDFALWKFSYLKGRSFDSTQDDSATRRQMEWPSPWGIGFPGWHIECSAMSKKHLGDQLDIHTGGADLIPVHHTNEIAQSQAASGLSPFVRLWVHGQFILVDGEKMAKSKGNFYRVSDIMAKGYDPLALRYLYATASYRAFLNFTWQALDGAAKSLKELQDQMYRLHAQIGTRSALSAEKLAKIDDLRQKFASAVANDLNMPQAVAVVWEVIKSNIPSPDKYDLVVDFDEVLGFDLANFTQTPKPVDIIPEEISKLLESRQEFRVAKKFADADAVRKQILDLGYVIEDVSGSQRVRKANG